MSSVRATRNRLSVVKQLTEAESATESRCPDCTQPDIADRWMVQCDVCEKYYHFSCAKVDETVSERCFCCTHCAKNITRAHSQRAYSQHSSRTGKSSILTNIQLKMQRLAEEQKVQETLMQEMQEYAKALREKAIQDEIEMKSKAMQEKLQRELDFIGKKYELSDGDDGSVKSHRSQRTVSSSVHRWLESQREAVLTSSGHENVPTSSGSPTGTIPKGTTVTTPAVSNGQPTSQANTQASQAQVTTVSQGQPVNSRAPIPVPLPIGYVAGGTVKTEVSTPQVPATTSTGQLVDLTSLGSGGFRRQPSKYDFPAPTPVSQPVSQDLFDVISPITTQQLALIQSQPRVPSFSETYSNALEKKVRDLQHQLDTLRLQSEQNRPTEVPRNPTSQQQPQSSGVASSVAPSVTQPNRFGGIATCQGMFNPPTVSFPSSQPQPLDLRNPPYGSNHNPLPFGSGLGLHTTAPVYLFGSPPITSSVSRPSVTCIPSYPNPIVTPVVSQISGANPSVPVCGPNAQQLAARHVVPKELPIFDGNPTDWPLFFSCYCNSTQMCGYTDAENLMRLQRCLKGNAQQAVSSQLLHPSSVPQIMATLQMLYGRPELVVNSLVSKVRSTPPPKADRLESVISFGLAVQNLCGHLRAMSMENHLSNPTLLQELIEKLPAGLKLDWALYQRHLPQADLRAFSDYMSTIASAASNVTFSTEVGVKQDKPKSKEKGFVNAHADENEKKAGHEKRKPSEEFKEKQPEQPRPCPVCQKLGHKARDCNVLKGQNIEERWKLVQQHHLCRRCLISHGKWPCKATGCGIQGCELRHHTLLHPGKPGENPTTSEQASGTSTQATGNVNVHRQKPRSTLFRILPVTLHGKESSVEVLAFLDDGSSFTLVEKEVADQLGIKGEVEPLCLQWTGNVTRTESESRVIQLDISGTGGGKRYTLECVRTVDSLDLPPQSLQFDQLAGQFPYLQGLPVKSYNGAVPRILIGLENTELLVTLKKRAGRAFEPVATKTKLGWTVYGTIEGLEQPYENRLLHICSESADRELHDVVKEFFSIENTGVTAAPVIEGDDDRRAREIMEKTTVRTASGRFETGLLWRYDHIEFPDSRPMAERRLKCLERRLEKTPELYENVRQQIVAYESKGYAHRASEAELSDADPRRTWYLPLGVVLNPNKPGKVRVVWDAAAKVDGVSFNSMLLKGPDLLTSLPAVLQRFRQRQIAVTGDIREMFHQLLIRTEDRQSQRFLWRDESTQAIHTYVMDVATFGSTCSPCSSQYVKNRNAEEWKHEFPEAAEAIVKNHYVDDYLDSRDTVEEATRIATAVKEVHAKAGFEVRNWLSNSDEVVRRVGDSGVPDLTKNFAVDKSTDTERVLGMLWQPSRDVFTFSVRFREGIAQLVAEKVVPTKREVLRIVMSLFDPLGLVAAFVVQGKCIIQDIWRANVGWDEKIPDEIFNRWRRWLEVLQELHHVTIPRCYFPDYSPDSLETLELHVFVDASEEAYACVAYFRIVDCGRVRCALVAAKSKVAPLKPLSIPRLELQAAVIGSRLVKSVQDNHTLPIRRRVIWSDSSTVLSWIQSDQRKYRQFVAVRVSEILSETNIEEWRWVPTRQNVADEATKWAKNPSFDADSRWFQGPEFLYLDESEWPKKTMPSKDTAEELRPVHAHHRKAPEPLINYSRFSKWERLLRATAFLRRYVTNLKRKVDGEAVELDPVLSQTELVKAEQFLWRSVQMEAYPDEVVALGKWQQQSGAARLENSSPLRKLAPFLDESGVIRLEGRTGRANFTPYDARFPVVLPRNHYVTGLVLDWFHRRYAHSNVETVVNEVRQKFHVSNIRTAVRQQVRRCNWCTVYKATPHTPRMAPLPDSRMSPYIRPFSFVGLDYCGPHFIRIGRSGVKRWIALFVCQTVRAVHLEVAGGLSTDSCIMAVRRFVGRRGAPRQIFSDQGTNFQGARKELRQQISTINGKLAETFTNCDTEWIFNPPAAPHMGGSWERLVRSVKTGLNALSTSRRPDEETFATVLVEVEAIINSRPLTHVPLDCEEDEALTPNHFLMLSSSGVVQPSKAPADTGAALRTNWKHAQELLDIFWARWVKEYLPTIRNRTKWFDDSKPIKSGDLVVVADAGIRNSWTRGKVVRVYPGRDGRIRSVDVQTSNGVLQRPVTKLAVLEVQRGDTAGSSYQQYGSGIVGDSQLVNTGLEPTMHSDRVPRAELASRDSTIDRTNDGTDNETDDGAKNH